MNWTDLIPQFLAAAGGGLSAYVAVRVDLATLKTIIDHLKAETIPDVKRTAERAHELAQDAHDRLNKLGG